MLIKSTYEISFCIWYARVISQQVCSFLCKLLVCFCHGLEEGENIVAFNRPLTFSEVKHPKWMEETIAEQLARPLMH